MHSAGVPSPVEGCCRNMWGPQAYTSRPPAMDCVIKTEEPRVAEAKESLTGGVNGGGKVEGLQAISASSEAIASTLFTVAWNGTLDVRRLKSERQLLVSVEPWRDVLQPVKQLYEAVEQVITTTADHFRGQEDSYSSVDWVRSLASEMDACIQFSYYNSMGQVHCNQRMGEAFFTSPELLEAAAIWRVTPLHALALFIAPDDITKFFEAAIWTLFVGGRPQREEGVTVKLQRRTGGEYAPCEAVIRAHSCRDSPMGTFLVQFRELPPDVVADEERHEKGKWCKTIESPEISR